MSININANLSLGAPQYLDNRQFVNTIDELLSLNINTIPEGFEVYVKDQDCKYKYNSTYTESDTGCWKKVSNTGTVQQPVIVDNTPVGTIMAWTGNTIPEGFLLCDGSTVSKHTYYPLYAVIGSTFGTSPLPDYFVLPDLRDKFIQGGSSVNDIGVEKEAGLPNIEGEFGVSETKSFYASSPTSGAFTIGNNVGSVEGYSGSGTYEGYRMSIDASRSNPIYGNSDTVQPPSITLVYIIKALPTDTSSVFTIIDDTNSSDETTYSSNKIDELINKGSSDNSGGNIVNITVEGTTLVCQNVNVEGTTLIL